MRESLYIGSLVAVLAACIVLLGALAFNAQGRPRQGWACPSGYVLISGTDRMVCLPGVTPHTTLIPPVETTPKP